MAMLLRRSALGGLLRRTGGPLLPASRQTEVLPSLARTFLTSSLSAARIRGSTARTVLGGQGSYHKLSNGNKRGLKEKFLLGVRAMSQEVVRRYWTPLNLREKFGAVYVMALAAILFDSAYDLHLIEKELAPIFEAAEKRRARASAENDVSQA